LQISGSVLVHERAEVMVCEWATPTPAFALGAIVLEVGENLTHVQLLLGREFHASNSSQ
jgi:hypothetical protein